MRQIESYLSFHATVAGNRPAFICHGQSITYAQLYALVKQRIVHLQQQSRHTVLIRSTQTIDFFITYFATHLAGKVAVPLEKDITEAHFNTIATQVETAVIPDDIADILFTTGTVGLPKGVMLNYRALLANAENLIDSQGFSKDTVFVISGPVNHIGSLSKIWPIIVVGGTIILTDGLKDINAFLAAFNYPTSKLATFLVPASLRMLLQFARQRLATYASKLDFIETGAAPMTQSDMEVLCELLPHTRLYNTYASTETGIVSTHDYCHDGCIAGCLGKPMRHASIHIMPDGTIACSGNMLMSGYVGDELLTRTLLHDGILYTSDIGYLDEEGRLCLEGRKDDIINIGGYKVSPIEVEQVAMAYPNITDCICISVDYPVIGNVLKLIYVSASGTQVDRKSLVAYLRQHLEAYKLPTLFESAATIARTFNGKLDRKFYRKL